MEAQLGFMSEKREDFEGSGHLLILADSAELVLESKGQKHDGGKEATADICEMRIEETGSQSHAKTPGLSHGWNQARSRCNPVVVPGQGKRMRLTQVKRLARSMGHFELQQNNSCMDGPARVTRLSELRRKARTGSDCLVRRAVEEVADKQLDRKTSEASIFATTIENQRREAIIAEIFGEGEGSRQDGDCNREQSDKRKEVVQHVSGEDDRNMVSTRLRSKRTSHLRRGAQQEKGREAYTPSEYLLAMLRRC